MTFKHSRRRVLHGRGCGWRWERLGHFEAQYRKHCSLRAEGAAAWKSRKIGKSRCVSGNLCKETASLVTLQLQ